MQYDRQGTVILFLLRYCRHYLGAAHGLAGVLHVLLMFRKCLSHSDVAEVMACLDWLHDNRYSR